jgi:DNA replication protein DnaC
MLIQHTINRLSEMRLSGMAQAFRQQLEQPALSNLSFEERFGLLVDYEWTTRQNRLLDRLLKKAKLRLPACFEDLDYQPQRGLDPSVMARLATCTWLEQHQNVIICGPTGAGKTYLACALGNAACRRGFTTRYYRVSRLLGELFMARGDGSYAKLLNRLQKVDFSFLMTGD